MTLSTFGHLWNKPCFKVLSRVISGSPEYGLTDVGVVGSCWVGGGQEAAGGKAGGPAISTKAIVT